MLFTGKITDRLLEQNDGLIKDRIDELYRDHPEITPEEIANDLTSVVTDERSFGEIDLDSFYDSLCADVVACRVFISRVAVLNPEVYQRCIVGTYFNLDGWNICRDAILELLSSKYRIEQS